MAVSGFDHVALPTSRPEKMIEFYGRLGFVVPQIDEWRKAPMPFFSVCFGNQKINFHTPSMWQNPDFQLRGSSAAPGCGDLCFVWDGDLRSLEAMLEGARAAIVVGPVELQGGRGEGTSVYVHDPDENLLEFIVYGPPDA